jgi:hypothetical protein
MGQVANVALTDTFDTWRVRSNQSFTNLFEINPTANTVSANTVTGATLVATSTVTVPAASISAVDVAFLANTNTFIGTKLDSSSYTTADVQVKAALANTNTFIGTKLDTASYTTADVQTKAALANTNTFIGTKLDSSQLLMFKQKLLLQTPTVLFLVNKMLMQILLRLTLFKRLVLLNVVLLLTMVR